MPRKKEVPVTWKYATPKDPCRDPNAKPPQLVKTKAGHSVLAGAHPLRLEIDADRWWDERCRRYFSSLTEARKYHE